MKVIIAGSRTLENRPELIGKAVEVSAFSDVSEIVSGTARGIDKLGEEWACRNGKSIKRFPAEWGRFGKSAGFVRNIEMAQYADGLIAIWDGSSSGTKHMIKAMRDLDKQVFVMKAEIKP